MEKLHKPRTVHRTVAAAVALPAMAAPRRREQPAREGKAPHSRASRPAGRCARSPKGPRSENAPAPMAATPPRAGQTRPNRRASRHRARTPRPSARLPPECAPERTPCRAPAAAPQCPPGPAGAQPAAARPAQGTAPARNARTPRSTAPEQPGLDLISRRPPKQKFANFEDYLAAHGGMTVPLPPEASDAADIPETVKPAEGCRMTPATAAALRCPVCGGPLLLAGRSLRCAKAHSFNLAKEGYAYLLPMQKKHAADPGDGKAMVRARRAFLSAGHYAPLMATLAALCAALPHDHIVDAGCGEGSYDKYLFDALGGPQIAAFDLSKEAVRLASKLVPDAAFCVGGGSFCAPVRDGWADLLLNIFSPMAEAEFARMLRPGGHLVYAVPTARHLFGLKEILYDCPYENEVRQTEYDGFAFVKAVESTAVITLEGQSVQDLFAMTPYYWNTPPTAQPGLRNVNA